MISYSTQYLCKRCHRFGREHARFTEAITAPDICEGCNRQEFWFYERLRIEVSI